MGGMRSPHVCALTGLSYRQLDFLTRSATCGPELRRLVPASGSGSVRRWPGMLVRRLMVAAHADRNGLGPPGDWRIPGPAGAARLPSIVHLILTGPPVPDAGWLIIGDSFSGQPSLSYAPTAVAVAERVAALGHGCQALDYDLHALALAAGVPDLDAALAGVVPAEWPAPAGRYARQLAGAR